MPVQSATSCDCMNHGQLALTASPYTSASYEKCRRNIAFEEMSGSANGVAAAKVKSRK